MPKNFNLDKFSQLLYREHSYNYIERFIERETNNYINLIDTNLLLIKFQSNISQLHDNDLAFLLIHSGLIPEHYKADSSEETFYSKLCEDVIREWAVRIGFKRSFLPTMKSSTEDVTILNDKNMPQAIKEKFLNKIYQNANKMSQIIDKLRLTLKLEEGKQELQLISSSMKKIIENCIGDLKDKYKNREINILGEDIVLKVDETLISMAISNLIENALKYSEDEIIVNISSNSICIIDKGIGIEEKELENINQKFYRISNNGWNNSLGLGLFIVQSILHLHNFSLEITSEFKKGSKFCIKY